MSIALGYKNYVWTFLKQINLYDDIGILFAETYEQNLIAWDYTSQNFGPAIPGEKSLLFMQLEQSTGIDNITRRYKRLQEVIASVGGLLNF